MKRQHELRFLDTRPVHRWPSIKHEVISLKPSNNHAKRKKKKKKNYQPKRRHFSLSVRISIAQSQFKWNSTFLVKIYRVTAILGINGPFTANITDCQADDEDILRLKSGRRTMFIPARYSRATQPYDHIMPAVYATPSEASLDDEASTSATIDDDKAKAKEEPNVAKKEGETDTE